MKSRKKGENRLEVKEAKEVFTARGAKNDVYGNSQVPLHIRSGLSPSGENQRTKLKRHWAWKIKKRNE